MSINPQEVPQENWTPQQKSLVKTLETLISDLNTQGWDKPGRIYFIDEPNEDPQVNLSGILPHHPVEDLQGAYHSGMRVPPETLGLAISTEAYRHLTIEEVLERKPDMLERLKAHLTENGHDLSVIPDEAILEQVGRHYYTAIEPLLAPAADLPDDMRAELRSAAAMLRDGTLITVAQTRDKDDTAVSVFAPGEFARQGIPTAMYLFLHDLFPDSEVADPIQSVSDYLAIQEIEKLGVHE